MRIAQKVLTLQKCPHTVAKICFLVLIIHHIQVHTHTHSHTGIPVYSNTATPSPLTVARGPRGLHTLITQLTWSKTPGKAVQYLITPSQTQARMTFTPPARLSVWPFEL